MLYHYTFNTYMGAMILEDKEIRSFLSNVFSDIAKEKGFEIVDSEILGDHVHMLIDQPYTISCSMVMKNIKGSSARQLFKEFESNRYDFRKLWARSFHCRKVPKDQKEIVIKYIKTQRFPDGEDKRFKGCENLFSRDPL
jgi:putative transposase